VKTSNKQSGFSLTEMLIATGIMAIGLVMVATVFPVGVKLTSLASERAIGAVVADEAFAKIQLYGMRDFEHWPAAQMNKVAGIANPAATYTRCDSYLYTNLFSLGPDKTPNYILPNNNDDFLLTPAWAESLYPSTVLSGEETQRYQWSALCRRVSLKEVQVTVFVNRRTVNLNNYRTWACNINNNAFTPDQAGQWPSPVKVGVVPGANPDELTVDFANSNTLLPNRHWAQLNPADPRRVLQFFSAGVTIVDDYTGKVYRVMEYRDADGDGLRDTLVLDQDWQTNPIASGLTECVWVVPPAVGSNRYPCVGVYQRVLYLENIQ
jgi:prepilin-type N-terminal cleavage/methylation domain-containing protein